MRADYARDNAEVVAMAASLQFITTKIGAGTFAQSWHITLKGQAWLNEQDTE